MELQLVTTLSHRYEGVWLNPGDRFTAKNQNDADELCCLGFARRVEAAPNYDTRVMTAEPTAAVAGDAVRQKRKYTRRDLTAQ